MDSTINRWTVRRELRNEKTKVELVQEAQTKLTRPLDLNAMTKPDLQLLCKSLGTSKSTLPICRTKKDYVRFLTSIMPGLSSASRLDKQTLMELSEEFNDKN